MSIRDYKKTSFADRDLTRLQQNVEQALTPIISSVIIDGNLLTNVQLLASQTNFVDHLLGRRLLGYIVVGKNANANVWDEQATNSLNAKTLNLRCDANCTVSLWVF